MSDNSYKVTVITIDEQYHSVFGEDYFPKDRRGGMLLSQRIDALNFRLRESEPGYVSDWHVAGDPTMIVVQQGIIRITLQNGEFRDFAAGDTFIARDFLPKDIAFDKLVHGHQAQVIGIETFKAAHIKLQSLVSS